MQVDFYHLTRDPVEKLVPMLAAKTLDIGKRLLLVSGNEAQRTAISKALWSDDPVSFLAHDHAGSEQEKDQPILIAEKFTTANGATFVILADGEWQDEGRKITSGGMVFFKVCRRNSV